MNTITIIAIVLVYIALGAHSVYFFVKRFTLYCDIEIVDIPYLVFAFLFPIIAHIATWMTIRPNDKPYKILFKKRS